MGEKRKLQSLFVQVLVSGSRLVLEFGAALFVVSGASVFLFVCALLRRLFWAELFSCLFLSSPAARALLHSHQQGPCVCGVHTEDRKQRSAVDRAHSLELVRGATLAVGPQRLRTPFRSRVEDRCSLLLSSSHSSPPSHTTSSYPVFFAVRFAGRRGGSGTSGLCIRSLLQPGQLLAGRRAF